MDKRLKGSKESEEMAKEVIAFIDAKIAQGYKESDIVIKVIDTDDK